MDSSGPKRRKKSSSASTTNLRAEFINEDGARRMGALTGRIAVVTGGGQGLGRAIVERMVVEDSKGVAVADLNLEAAQEVADELKDRGALAIAIRADVTNE